MKSIIFFNKLWVNRGNFKQKLAFVLTVNLTYSPVSLNEFTTKSQWQLYFNMKLT